MPGFLYFIESDRPAFDSAELDRLGLRYAIESSPRAQPLRAGSSPSGAAGFIVADSAAVDSCKYQPDKQTWQPRQPADGVWIGYPKDNPPPLVALARDKQLPGREIPLCDGTRIHVPIARRWAEHNDKLLWSIVLPQTLRRDDEGQWVPKDVSARYRQLWQLLCGYIDAAEAAMQNADAAPGASIFFSYEPINELAIAAITANYRAAADEVEICGVYDVETRDAIIRVLKDDATREAWVKKKLQAWIDAGGTSSPGPTDSTTESTAAIAPPSPISTPTASVST